MLRHYKGENRRLVHKGATKVAIPTLPQNRREGWGSPCDVEAKAAVSESGREKVQEAAINGDCGLKGRPRLRF